MKQYECIYGVKDVRHRCGLMSVCRMGSDPDVMKRLLVEQREAEGETGRPKKWRVLQRTEEALAYHQIKLYRVSQKSGSIDQCPCKRK